VRNRSHAGTGRSSHPCGPGIPMRRRRGDGSAAATRQLCRKKARGQIEPRPQKVEGRQQPLLIAAALPSQVCACILAGRALEQMPALSLSAAPEAVGGESVAGRSPKPISGLETSEGLKRFDSARSGHLLRAVLARTARFAHAGRSGATAVVRHRTLFRPWRPRLFYSVRGRNPK
jgi:hypothetical protein